jgi:hypothetical protein
MVDGSKSAAHLKQTDYLVRGIPQAAGFTYLGFFLGVRCFRESAKKESLKVLMN